MKTIGWTAVAMLALLVAVATPASAQGQSETDARVRAPERPQLWTLHRAKTWESDHRTWVQRGGYQGVRVPDEQFRLNFGDTHTFRINSLPYRIVNNEPSFQYGGYWLSVVDPWPESWEDGWYDQDDVYVRYDNGYYLHDSRHPDVALSLAFSN